MKTQKQINQHNARVDKFNQALKETKSQHTPGPWRSGDRFNTVFGPNLGKPSPEIIATVQKGNEANARLIASAPDMLAVLKSISSEWSKHDSLTVSEVIDSIDSVIAKAEGVK